VTENAAVSVKNPAFYFESCIWAVFELSVANKVEVDDLIFKLTRGKHSIYTPGI
jgi:hypothetical protein